MRRRAVGTLPAYPVPAEVVVGLRDRLRVVLGRPRVAPVAPRVRTPAEAGPALQAPAVVIIRPVPVAAAAADEARVVDVREAGADLPGVRRVPRVALAAWVAERPVGGVLLGVDDLDGAAAAERCAALGLVGVGWIVGGVDGWRAAGRPMGEVECGR